MNKQEKKLLYDIFHFFEGRKISFDDPDKMIYEARLYLERKPELLNLQKYGYFILDNVSIDPDGGGRNVKYIKFDIGLTEKGINLYTLYLL